MSRTSADLALLGATLHTFDPEHPSASALAVRDGVLIAVGDDATVRRACDARTEVIDGTGMTLTPGLTDAHLHPVHGALMTRGLDLSAYRDIDALRDALARARRTAEPGAWIRGFGLDPNILDGRPPHRDLVDDVLDGAPALLTLFDGHAALASGRALERAGVTGPVALAGHAEIVCDTDGVPTGELLEAPAMEYVERAAPVPTTAQIAAELAALTARMNACGLTGGHVMDLAEGSLPALRLLDERDELTLRLRCAPWAQPGVDDDSLRRIIELQGTGGRLWQVGGVKLFMDGTVDHGTAWLHEPDCHGESTKPFWLPPDQYATVVDTLARAGVPTATHAIGDAAVDYALTCLTPHSSPGSRAARHRIEHIETASDDLIARFATSGVVASMQPSHVQYTLADHTDNWSTRLGTERALRAWRCADLLHAGAPLVLGSDWPIAHFDPREVLAAAQLRRLPRHSDRAPVTPAQALTAHEALEAMTVTPALAAGEQDRAGRIRVGLRADITAFAADPLSVSPLELAETPIRLTVVDGQVVHRG